MDLVNGGHGRKQDPLVQLFMNNFSVPPAMLCCGYIQLTSGLRSTHGLKCCLQNLNLERSLSGKFHISPVVSLKVKSTLFC